PVDAVPLDLATADELLDQIVGGRILLDEVLAVLGCEIERIVIAGLDSIPDLDFPFAQRDSLIADQSPDPLSLGREHSPPARGVVRERECAGVLLSEVGER